MWRRPLAANALPLLVAASGCTTWVDVLATYKETCELLSGMYKPTPEELHRGLSKMETSWGVSLFYYGIIKGICGCEHPQSRLVGLALERFKRYGNFYAIKRIMEDDVDMSSNQGARSALMYASFTGMWDHAVSIFESHIWMQQNLADTRRLVNILSAHGRWSHAIRLLYRRSPPPPSLNPILVRPIFRSLGLAGEYKRMLRLLAASVAQGYKIDEVLFSVLVRPLQRSGQWNAALDTALDLGLLSSSRESNIKDITLYGALADCLYSSDPYFNFTLQEIVDDMTHRMHPRKLHELKPNRKTERSFRFLSTGEMFRMYHRYLHPLSTIISGVLSFGNVHYRPVSELAIDAFKQEDLLLVLDTNFLIQCTSKNLPLVHFHSAIQRQYPHLEGKPLQRVILPFTTVREAYQLIWSPATQLRRGVRNLLWSRVVSFLRQSFVTVLALSSEFPCSSFSVISRLAYSRLGEPASPNDPDLRILNTCVALQYTLRQQNAMSLQGLAQLSDGAMLFSFLKYHVRRHHRDVRGVASQQLLLCTLDKRLSAAADELGIQTFPHFQNSNEVPTGTSDK